MTIPVFEKDPNECHYEQPPMPPVLPTVSTNGQFETYPDFVIYPQKPLVILSEDLDVQSITPDGVKLFTTPRHPQAAINEKRRGKVIIDAVTGTVFIAVGFMQAFAGQPGWAAMEFIIGTAFFNGAANNLRRSGKRK